MSRSARRVLILAGCLVAVVPASAHAGTYHVYACDVGGVSWGNGSWTGPAVAGLVVDTACAQPGQLVGLRIDGGKTIANGASAALTFTSPPGTTIANFTVDRHLEFDSNPPLQGTRPLYATYQLGATVFAGAGDYDTATRDRLRAVNAWYGYPANDATLTRRTTSLRQMGALAGYAGDARTLTIQVGCFRRATNCSGPAGGRVFHVLYGADITVSDPQPPAPTVLAEGLLAGGPRSGSDPVAVSATDNAGVRRVELHDVTGEPQLVGAEDYAAGAKTETGATCSARLAKTCPDLARELIRPTALQAGRRRLLVRTIDAGGNPVDRGPYAIDVATPSDRGARNGAGATDSATLTASFAGRRRRTRTVRYGTRVRVVGRLVNDAGQPIGGAELALRTTNKRPGASTFTRKTFLTKPDGTFSTRTRGRATQRLEIAWRSHLNDTIYAAAARLRLRTRATATLRASTRRPAVGRAFTLRGHLRAPARGVTVILQGRAIGRGRYTTFADTTTRRGGRFRVTYRFRDAGSRGKAFRFRAKLRGDKDYPFATGYSPGVTVRVR